MDGAGIIDTLFGGLKRVGEAGVDVGKAVAEIPLNIVTAIPDFVKDPEVFLSGGKHDAIGALLSSDFRKKRKADLTAARDWEKMTQTKDAVDWVQKMFSGQATDTAQGELRKTMVAQGMDNAMLQPIANAAKAERHAARKGGAAAGLLPAVANIADVNAAQQAGQAQLGNRFNLEEQTHGGQVTRQNQGNQYTLSDRLARTKHGYRMGEMDQGSRLRMTEAGYGATLKDWNDAQEQGRKYGYATGLSSFEHGQDRINEKYKADIGDSADEAKQARTEGREGRRDKRRFGQKTEAMRYQATLDEWKRQQSQGKTPDPYPVLAEMGKRGIFASNPQAEQAALAHLAQPTDAKGAAQLVQTWQHGMKPAAAGGVPSTSRERIGQTYLKDLKLRKRAGMVPTGMEREAKMTLKSRNPTGAQQLLARMNDRAAGNVKGESAVEAAKRYVTSPEFGNQTPAMQGIIQEALANDDAATLAGIWPKVVSHDEAGVRAVLADPRFKKIKEEAAALQETKRGLALSLEAASIPGRPGEIRKDLFGPYLSMLPDEMVAQYGNLTQNREWQAAKAGLQSAGNMSLSSFVLGRSGKQSSDKEYRRLQTAWPFGNEVSDTVYLAKMRAVERATAATEAMMKREAELIANSGLDPEGQIAAAFATTEGQRIRTSLIAELEHINGSQADQMPDRPLTAQQQAELDGGR